MENTLYETFFNEVCPSSYILDQKKIGQTGRMVVLRSTDPRRPSRLYMDYITDREAGRSHFAGGNWGFFGVSQAEEITRDDFNKLLGRLSRKVPRNYALLECNLQGHNWIYEEFYSGGNYTFDLNDPKTMYKVVRKANRVGVAARSEENRVSAGGFVKDEYFQRLRETMPPDWIARQLDCSFDDFTGKIFKGFNLSSVHHIDAFPIPDHWGWLVSIDPGGSDPTCVAIFRIDTSGNLICVDEFYRPNVHPDIIIGWIRDHAPREARYVIDYENRIFTIQLQQDYGIVCEPAIKDVYAGCQQAASYFWPVSKKPLPSWYAETQPAAMVERFKDGGSPRIFFVKGKCPMIARSCDNHVWDEKHPERPKPGDDHGADSCRYAAMSRPHAASRNATEEQAWREQNDPLRHLLGDRASYESAKYGERLLERARRDNASSGVADLSSDGLYVPANHGEVQLVDEFM